MAVSLVAACNSSSMAGEQDRERERERKDVVSCFFSNEVTFAFLIERSSGQTIDLGIPFSLSLSL